MVRPSRVTVVAIALGGAAAFFCVRNERSLAVAWSSTSAVTLRAPSLPEIGTTTRFDLDLTSEITLHRSQRIEHRATGVLRRTLLAGTNAGTLEILVVEQPQATQKALREERRSSVERALAHGVLVERNAAQRALRVRVPNDAGRDETDALRQLAELTQLAPLPADTLQLTVDESAIAGRLAARYEGRSIGDRLAITRHVQLANGTASAGLASDLRGAFEATLSERGGRLLALRGEQTETKSHVRTGAVFARAVTRIALAFVDEAPRPAALPDLASFGDWIALEGPLAPAPDAAVRTLTALAEEHSLDELLGLVRDAASNGAARAALDRTLWAFLTVHPEACKAIATQIASTSLRDDGAQVALSGLFRAGHAPAQRALADVVRAWKASSDATAVVAMFGSLPDATEESEGFLRSLRDDAGASPELASSAGLALASAGGRLRESSPVRAAAVADECEQRVSHADTPLALAQGLAALGNVGSERIAELATPRLEHDDPLVRRMAIHALALGRSVEAKARVAQLAETDPDPTVREEAKDALSALGS